MTAMVLPMTSTESKDMPDLDKSADDMKNGKDVKGFEQTEDNIVYKTRMSDVIRDIIRLGYY